VIQLEKEKEEEEEEEEELKMGAPKKGATRFSEDPEELARVPLQAILLADSFTTKFRPITLERPKVPSLSRYICISLYICMDLCMYLWICVFMYV
jgi:hypothetical protein